MARGITGFTFDSMSTNDVTNQTRALPCCWRLRSQRGRYTVQNSVMPDITVCSSFRRGGADHYGGRQQSRVLPSKRWAIGGIRIRYGAGTQPPDGGKRHQPLTAQGIHVARRSFLRLRILGLISDAPAFSARICRLGDHPPSMDRIALEGDSIAALRLLGIATAVPVDPQRYRRRVSVLGSQQQRGFRTARLGLYVKGDADWVQLVTRTTAKESSRLPTPTPPCSEASGRGI